MVTVYVVTSGIYSDYSIDAIFESKEAAEAFITSRVYTEGHNIKEFTLGKVTTTYIYYVDYFPSSDKWNIANVDEPIQDYYITNVVVKTYDRYYVYVQAKNRDAALKIANEKIMMAIAGGM